MGETLTDAIENVRNDFTNQVVALLESVSREIALVLSFICPQHLAQMCVTSHDDNTEHGTFSAFPGSDGFV